MKEFGIELLFAYKDDGPSELDKYGMKMTEDDLKNKRYNKTYTRRVLVNANNLLEAGAKAMLEMNKIGYTEGNYLYLLKIKKLFTNK